MRRYRWTKDVVVCEAGKQPVDIGACVSVQLVGGAYRIECLDGSVCWFSLKDVELVAEGHWQRRRVGQLADGRWVLWERTPQGGRYDAPAQPQLPRETGI